MNERVKILRDQSINSQPSLSLERALLMTEFYKSGVVDKVSIPVARALAFKYVLENKELCINEGELIIGERGPQPVATPTYPEICTHTLEDLETLNSRSKNCYHGATTYHDVYHIPLYSHIHALNPCVVATTLLPRCYHVTVKIAILKKKLFCHYFYRLINLYFAYLVQGSRGNKS